MIHAALPEGHDYRPSYQGRAGIYTGGLNGAYFLDVLDKRPDGTLFVTNLCDVGKIKCPNVQATIEADLIHPLVRGRSVARWSAKPEGYVLLVQDPATQRGYSEEWLQENYPLTWSYLTQFEELLLNRKAFLKFFNSDRDPFYSMYSITNDTFARYKVVWMDISATTKAAVLVGGEHSPLPIPEHTVMFLTTDTEDEAHYVTAILNSDLVNTVVSGYIVDNHLSTHPIENIVIPKYDATNQVHERLSSLSREAHLAVSRADSASLVSIEKDINSIVGKVWQDDSVTATRPEAARPPRPGFA
jgi:hypothetical protein